MIAVFEGVSIALDSLRGNKARASLTILGVAIGVMVVMVVASMVQGINSGFSDMFDQLGPRTFFVFRHFQGGVVISDGSENSPWRRNPPLTSQEAERLEQLASISMVVVHDERSRPVKYGNTELASVRIKGFGTRWLDVSGGDIYPGRSFTHLEAAANARVTVINVKLSENLFGQSDPIGRDIKIDGVPFRVIGIYTPPPDLFGQGNNPAAVIPYGSFHKYVSSWDEWIDIMVGPADGVIVADAIADVTAALRGMRRLRPSEENNFSVVTQDKLLESFNKVTGVFFLVMLVLSSVGLMVGGVGVVAIMMISVTERTREIGIRKALGATKREILWQFLVEAATLTLVGGAVGMVLGGGISWLVATLSPLPAEVPLWAVVTALGASVITGIGFGMYPAAKAAQLDPIEALRHE
jgi:putative ABC transport system permease protein